MQRRNFVRAAGCAAAFAWTAGWAAQKPRTIWSKEAFDAARPAAEAVQRHPFVTGVFAGTLRKSAFVSYLEQNLFYLSSYARALDVVAGRLGELSGFSKESQDFARWAQETRDLRQWTIDFASSLTGSRIDQKALCPAAETLAYIHLEERSAAHEELPAAAAALLPCFWIYDEFAEALRARAVLKGNPFRQWIEPLGSTDAHQSALRAAAAVDRLAEAASAGVLSRMKDLFVAGCWHEWSLFEAALRS